MPYFDGGWSNWVFFCGQAVGITIEDIAIAVGRKCGIRETCEYVFGCLGRLLIVRTGFTKMLGFAWVGAWFSVLLPIGTAQNLALGQQDIRNPLIAFSFADWLFGKA